jgi:Catenin-beta-like, Arm-motif containing nuclear
MLHETAPELYPQMVELGTVTSLLGLLTHENTDISISAITVLQDLTDADVILEREEVCVYVSMCAVTTAVGVHSYKILSTQLCNAVCSSHVHSCEVVIATAIAVKALAVATTTT